MSTFSASAAGLAAIAARIDPDDGSVYIRADNAWGGFSWRLNPAEAVDLHNLLTDLLAERDPA